MSDSLTAWLEAQGAIDDAQIDEFLARGRLVVHVRQRGVDLADVILVQ